MRVLLATVYSSYGGSARILFASRDALAEEHEVVVRAPLAEADSRIRLCMPSRTLDSLWRKMAVLPLLCAIVFDEWCFLRKHRFDVIYVHDEPSLYVYGLIAKALGLQVVWNINMREGKGLKRWIRNRLCDRKIHVSAFTQHEAGGGGVLIRYPVTVLSQRTPGRRKIRDVYQLGSICRRKNQLLAVESFHILHGKGFPIRLHLCGTILEDDYYRMIRQRILDLGLVDIVSFDGYIAANEAYARADLILCPAMYESVGLTLIEALGAGIPVVASDIPAHRETAELVGLNKAALVPQKAEDFAEAIANTPFMDVEKCSQRIREVFGFDRFASELRAMFRTFEHLPVQRSAR